MNDAIDMKNIVRETTQQREKVQREKGEKLDRDESEERWTNQSERKILSLKVQCYMNKIEGCPRVL